MSQPVIVDSRPVIPFPPASYNNTLHTFPVFKSFISQLALMFTSEVLPKIKFNNKYCIQGIEQTVDSTLMNWNDIRDFDADIRCHGLLVANTSSSKSYSSKYDIISYYHILELFLKNLIIQMFAWKL